MQNEYTSLASGSLAATVASTTARAGAIRSTAGFADSFTVVADIHI